MEHAGTQDGNLYEYAENRLKDLSAKGLYRFLRIVDGPQGAKVRLGDQEVLLLCSNNYLGLAGHPKLAEAAAAAAWEFGCSASASRLISGTMRLHERLERKLADFMDRPDVLVFSSGYAANVGCISSLVGSGDVILSDQLNHASIIDGCRLSRAEVKIYRHGDMEHLEFLLERTTGAGKRLIVTETLFSMDGDMAPLVELVKLARRYRCILMVDEAHAIGVQGPRGRGIAEMMGVEQDIDIVVGTMGKALGCFGAFVACPPVLRNYFINHARSFIFSTALPPPVLGAVEAALDIVASEPERRSHVAALAASFYKGFTRIAHAHTGCRVTPATESAVTQIQGLILGEDRIAVALSNALLTRGVYVQAIRPPSVPAGTARLRCSLTAAHTVTDIEYALWAIDEALKEVVARRELSVRAS